MSDLQRVDTNDYKECTPFAEHTAYMALDTITIIGSYQWQKTIYEKGQKYIIGREIPQRLARILVSDNFARTGRTLWENQTSFAYRVACIEGIDTIYVPRKSLTDFYSVPRAFWSLYPPTGVGRKAAHLHDILCTRDVPVRYVTTDGHTVECVHPVSSQDAARIFDEAMQVALVGNLERRLKYYGVRWFGPRYKACNPADET